MTMRLTHFAHHKLREHLRPGDIAIDATAGNGHDTLFLAQLVGPTGQVLACDVQSAAVDATTARLATHGVTWTTLTLGCHSEFLGKLQITPSDYHPLAPSPLVGEGRGEGSRLLMTRAQNTINCSQDPSPQPSPTRGEGGRENTLRGQVAAVVFNLGFLPQSDSHITTQPVTTCQAIEQAWQLLKPGGVLSILAYRGHAGGVEECEAVEVCVTKLAGEAVERYDRKHADAPRLYFLIRPETEP
jgi:SAM-dependent methyltransferase